jgi:hypothetical protein
MERLRLMLRFLLVLFCTGSAVFAQRANSPVKENDHLMVLLDLNSSDAALDSLLRSAGIEKPDVKSIKAGNYQSLQQKGWNTVPLPGNHLRIDHSVGDIVNTGKGFITVNDLAKGTRPGYPAEVLYGVNNFARVTVHELPNGLTRFFVPGRKDSKRVMLSGNFNSWSTLQGQMMKTDSGWIKDVRLEPGIYNYKFIFDGRWDIDVNNNIKRDDGAGNTNSVYYRCNFTFKLNGYDDAHRVVVMGSFNRWNAGELIMNKVSGGWELKLFLHDGMHLYHFIVDGQPVTDPDNKLVNKDESGNKNSVVNLGQTMIFRLGGFEDAQHVYLAGSFNNWVPNELAMQKVNNVWTLPLTLPAGNYEYKFVVDGQWMPDPTNQQKTHSNKGPINSFIAVKPNHTFVLKGYGNATVRLAGTFNNWDPEGFTMQHKGDEWIISLRLKPGKYLYKFIINQDDWIRDPANPLWEQNAERTGNSVLWVD